MVITIALLPPIPPRLKSLSKLFFQPIINVQQAKECGNKPDYSFIWKSTAFGLRWWRRV